MLLDLTYQGGVVQIVDVDVDGPPMTTVVIFDGDDAEPCATSQMLSPMVHGWRIAEDARLSLFLPIALAVVLNIECSVRPSIPCEQREVSLCKVHSSASV